MPGWTWLSGGGRRRLTAPVAATVLALMGLGAIGAGLAAQQHAPQPPASAALPTARGAQPVSSGAASPSPLTSSPPSGPVLPAAVPTAISIPAIGVGHSLIRLGENRDGTLQVPPLSDVATPGWDGYSPTPGQLGPSVIVGHVDSAAAGRGVFYDLGALRPGATVSIARADRTVAVFRVNGVNKYPKNAFPTLKVYGNTPNAQLRLITCGGQFDPRTGSYLDNIVVYATLISSHPA
jgi:sortase (surface protein transpeptidase)